MRASTSAVSLGLASAARTAASSVAKAMAMNAARRIQPSAPHTTMGRRDSRGGRAGRRDESYLGSSSDRGRSPRRPLLAAEHDVETRRHEDERGAADQGEAK